VLLAWSDVWVEGMEGRSGRSVDYRTDNTVSVWLHQRMAPSRCMRGCGGILDTVD
jgi:hypothetical protein